MTDIKRTANKVRAKLKGKYHEYRVRDFFCVFSVAEIRPHSQWNLGDLNPNFEKKIPILKKIFLKKLKVGIFIQSTHTHTSYKAMFFFNLMTIVCVIMSKLFITSLFITEYSLSDINLQETDLFPLKFPLYNRIFT